MVQDILEALFTRSWRTDCNSGKTHTSNNGIQVRTRQLSIKNCGRQCKQSWRKTQLLAAIDQIVKIHPC